MSDQKHLPDFDTTILPHITIASTTISSGQELCFSDYDSENNPIRNLEVLMIGFSIEGMLESHFEGIKPAFLSTPNTSITAYAPFENHFRLPGRQRFDAFTVSIHKDFFTTHATMGDEWAEDILQKMEKQLPFSVIPEPMATAAPIQNLIQQIRSTSPNNTLNKLYLQSKVSDLLYTYFSQLPHLQSHKHHEGFNTADVDKLHELKLYLQNNFLNDFSLEGLSKWSGLNLFKLKKGFKMVHGTTVFDYLRHLRMEYASMLLRDTQLNVGEVAYQLGYSHLNHFSAAFKKHYGHPPTQWKLPDA